METKELEVNRELRAIRNYGILVLVAFFILNTTTLFALSWFETNDLRHELISLSDKLPSRGDKQVEQTFNLPEDIISLQSSAMEHTGFYETKIVGKDYIAYANPDKKYILMKSRDGIQGERNNFALALFALYIGEIVIMLGWWFFIRARVRTLFNID